MTFTTQQDLYARTSAATRPASASAPGESGVVDKGCGARNPKPGTRSLEPETRNPHPEPEGMLGPLRRRAPPLRAKELGFKGEGSGARV